MTRPRHTSSWLAATLACAALLLAGPAQAHDGHSNRAAWDACDGQALGDSCEWTSGHDDRYIGSCRRVAAQLMCVRNQPIIRDDPAARSQSLERGHARGHAHGPTHAHTHAHTPDAAPREAGEMMDMNEMSSGELLLSACAAVVDVVAVSLRQVGAQTGTLAYDTSSNSRR